jgi:hypothetical protein
MSPTPVKGVRGSHPRENFGILYCILVHWFELLDMRSILQKSLKWSRAAFFITTACVPHHLGASRPTLIAVWLLPSILTKMFLALF